MLVVPKLRDFEVMEKSWLLRAVSMYKLASSMTLTLEDHDDKVEHFYIYL